MGKNWTGLGGLALALSGLAACGTSVDDPRLVFNQAYQDSEDEFQSILATSPTDFSTLTSPSASASYSGQSGFSVSTDNATLDNPSDILAQGGDFLAVGDVALSVDLTQTNPTFSGTMTVVEADEGHTMSGSLALAGTVDGADNAAGTSATALSGTLTGSLTLDGATLTVTSGAFTSGLIVGSQADSLWANHESSTWYQGTTGLITGGLYANAD